MAEALPPIDPSVQAVLAALDGPTAHDSRRLIELMQRITGHQPRIWNVATIGFGTYHYRYESGREGDSHCLGFYPRKRKLTIYLMDGTARHADQLAALGKHSSSRVCLYVKGLDEIALPVLEQVLQRSYEFITSQDGTMRRVE
jgi:hypothetical protein